MNVAMLLDMAASAFGDRVVLGAGTRTLTPDRLVELAAAGGARLREAGRPAVVYASTYGPAFACAVFSAANAGVPVVPLNYRLGVEQLGGLVANHAGALVLGDDAALAGGGNDVEAPEAWLAELDAAARAGATTEPPHDPELPAVLLYTSGTTSAAKAVILRHRHLTSYVLSTVELGAADPSEASLVSVPPYHVAGVANLLTNLYAGRRAVVLETFTPERWLETARGEAVTHALVVPTMLARIVDLLGDGRADVPTLRSLAYGGARTPAPVLERALRAFPGVEFVHAYGLTETSSTIAVLGPEDHRLALASDDPAVHARLGSVGRLVPGVDVEIRDPAGRAVGPNEAGRVWLRGEQISGEYVGADAALDAHGWFDTRDRGHVDDDGYLFIEGRDDETIIRGAENIAPAEIEDVLIRHPDVDDAVVVGLPDQEWGQRLAAVVVPRPGAAPDPDDLRAWVRARLRSSRTPERIEVWPDLPRTDNGKVIRRQVTAELLRSS